MVLAIENNGNVNSTLLLMCEAHEMCECIREGVCIVLGMRVRVLVRAGIGTTLKHSLLCIRVREYVPAYVCACV